LKTVAFDQSMYLLFGWHNIKENKGFIHADFKLKIVTKKPKSMWLILKFPQFV